MSSSSFALLALNGSVLPGVHSLSLDLREKTEVDASSGSVHATTAAVVQSAPMVSASTVAVRALANLLTKTGELPHLVLTGLDLYGGVGAGVPGYLSGSSHMKRAATAGVALLKGISWSKGSPASASLDCFALSANGTTAPFATTTAALPTLPINTEQCVVSACTLGGSALPGVVSVEISIDHKTTNDADDCFSLGLPFPTAVVTAGAGGAAEITATIETADLSTPVSGVLSVTYAVLNHLGCGTSASTLTAAINGAITREEAIPGESGQPARRRITVRGTYDGSTKPLTLSVA